MPMHVPMAPSRRPAWSQVSAAPRHSSSPSHIDVTHMFTRRHAQHTIGNLLPRQFPSPAISFHANLNGTVFGTCPRPPRALWSCAHDAHSFCAPCMFMVLLGFYMCSLFLLVSSMPLVLLVLLVRLVSSCQLLSAPVPPSVDRTFSLVPPGCRIG